MNKSLSRENLLYLSAFLLALAIRLIRLGAWPLTDWEAGWALQALGIARGAQPALGSQPAYIMPSALLFFLFGGATNFLARLVPALAGSALVFVPYLFRERLKPRPSLILAFCLVLDPGLAALSRQAGSAIMALTFFLLAWGLWENHKPRAAGVLAGLALLSGAALWAGLLGLALAWALCQGLEAGAKRESVPARTRSEWMSALWFCLGTLVAAGTLFFVSPHGLSAWLGSLPEYFKGWVAPSGVSAGFLLLSLLFHQPLGIIFAVIAVIRGWRFGSRRAIRLSVWLLVSLLLAFFYPAHQVSDLAWSLIPLWALASLELARNLEILPEERREVFGVIALCALLLVFSWLDLTGIAADPYSALSSALVPVAVGGRVLFNLPPSRYLLLFGSLLLLTVSLLLVAVGWSARSARLGTVWGLVTALGLYSLGAMFGAAGLRTARGAEMWSPGFTPAEADLLLGSVNQISDTSRGNQFAQPVTLAGVDSPALAWLLRDHQVEITNSLDPAALPPIMIAPQQNEAVLEQTYRGQEFKWRQEPLWADAQTADWIRWAAFHQMPSTEETLILWVRNDLFLDASGNGP